MLYNFYPNTGPNSETPSPEVVVELHAEIPRIVT